MLRLAPFLRPTPPAVQNRGFHSRRIPGEPGQFLSYETNRKGKAKNLPLSPPIKMKWKRCVQPGEKQKAEAAEQWRRGLRDAQTSFLADGAGSLKASLERRPPCDATRIFPQPQRSTLPAPAFQGFVPSYPSLGLVNVGIPCDCVEPSNSFQSFSKKRGLVRRAATRPRCAACFGFLWGAWLVHRGENTEPNDRGENAVLLTTNETTGKN